MQTYLLSAAGVIFLSVIVSLLIPEGKLNKTITFVMRLICILVLIQPITGFFDISSDGQATENIFDYEYICKEYSRHQSTQLELLIAKEFEVECECTVEVEYSDGNFEAKSVEVELEEKDGKLVDLIYEYLREQGYINITVYAKST